MLRYASWRALVAEVGLRWRADGRLPSWVAGQLDDAMLVAFVFRRVFRAAAPGLLREHWPGPDSSLEVLVRLAYGRSGRPGPT